MAVTTTSRLGITRWSAGGDFFNRAQMDASHAALETKTAIYLQGIASARPTAGTSGRFYFASDTKVLSYDDGVAWRSVQGGAVNDGTKTLTLGGNLTLTGAYTTTLTVTGTTNLTLPTTGTLATTVGGDDIEITSASKGLILKSANSTRYRVTVDNDGSLVTTAL